MAAQAVHAAFEYAVVHPKQAAAWYRESNYLVLLEVPGEGALQDLSRRAQLREIPAVEVREPDYDDQLTAIVLGPGDAARKLCSSLPLAMREVAMV